MLMKLAPGQVCVTKSGLAFTARSPLIYDTLCIRNLIIGGRGGLHRKMLSSKNGVAGNIGNIEFNFENGNIDSKAGSNGVKWGHSIPYHRQQGHPPPTGDPV